MQAGDIQHMDVPYLDAEFEKVLQTQNLSKVS